MQSTRERTISVGRALITEFRAEKLPLVAGSIAYHAFVSLLPLLVLVLAALSIFGDPTESVLLDLSGSVLTRDASAALLKQLKATKTTTGVSIVGGLILVWGALRIFRNLDAAFSGIYETEARNSIPDQFTDAAVVFVSFAFAVAVAWTLNGTLAAIGTGPLAWALGRLILVFGVAITFVPIYYVFPDADVSLREIFPGLGVAAVGLVALTSVFQFYAATKAGGSSVIVGILALLTWLYFGGLIVLVGAAINAVLSNRSLDVSIDPVIGRPATTRATDRERLAENLQQVATSAQDGDELVLATDATEIHLPSPQHATVGGENSSDDGDSTVRLDLRWILYEPTDQENPR